MSRKLEQILELFQTVPDEDYRAELLIEFANRYHPPDPSQHPEPHPPETRVPGCESEVYIFADPLSDGRLYFSFAVQNPQGVSAKALASILQEALNGADLSDIESLRPDMIHEIFGRTVSMGKGQGLMNMVNIIKFLARRARAELNR